MKDSIRNKVLQIEMYAKLLNGEPTKRDLTGDKPTVFYDFNGHISLFRVRFYNHGWESLANPESVFEVYLDWEYSYVDENGKMRRYPTEETLDLALSRVKNLYKEWRNKPCRIMD